MLNELKQRLEVINNPDAKDWVERVCSKHFDRLSLGQVEHVLDYFDAHPNKRLRKMSVDTALRLSHEWVERLKKKGNNIVETEEDVEVFMKFTNARIVKLKSKSAYLREGNLMSHCVGDYYGKNVDIYSLRDANNQPHCTIEVDRDNINQIKGKGNGSIHPKYIKFILAFMDKIGKKVRESELRYMGYIPLSQETWDFIDRKTTNVKEMTYGGKRYYFTGSNFKIKG